MKEPIKPTLFCGSQRRNSEHDSTVQQGGRERRRECLTIDILPWGWGAVTHTGDHRWGAGAAGLVSGPFSQVLLGTVGRVSCVCPWTLIQSIQLKTISHI